MCHRRIVGWVNERQQQICDTNGATGNLRVDGRVFWCFFVGASRVSWMSSLPRFPWCLPALSLSFLKASAARCLVWLKMLITALRTLLDVVPVVLLLGTRFVTDSSVISEVGGCENTGSIIDIHGIYMTVHRIFCRCSWRSLRVNWNCTPIRLVGWSPYPHGSEGISVYWLPNSLMSISEELLDGAMASGTRTGLVCFSIKGKMVIELLW